MKPLGLGCALQRTSEDLDRASSDHEQNAADLRQQRDQDQAQHGKVIPGRRQCAPAHPCDDMNRGLSLRVGDLLDLMHGDIQRLPPFVDHSRSRQNLPTPPRHSRSRAAIALQLAPDYISRSIAGCLRFLHFTQCFDLPP